MKISKSEKIFFDFKNNNSIPKIKFNNSDSKIILNYSFRKKIKFVRNVLYDYKKNKTNKITKKKNNILNLKIINNNTKPSSIQFLQKIKKNNNNNFGINNINIYINKKKPKSENIKENIEFINKQKENKEIIKNLRIINY